MAAHEDAAALKAAIVAFAQNATAEITTHDEALLPKLRDLLGAGTGVYVAHTPKATVEEVAQCAVRVQEAGLTACPHVGARRLRSREQLASVLACLRDGGVTHALLVGGDVERPAGPFASVLDVLETGLTVAHGIGTIGVAGYPEGHRLIADDTLWDALARKAAFAESTGTRMHVVTQFGFDPAAVLAWSREVAARGIALPVHTGIAGPVPLPRLIRYAVHCGIGPSLKALMREAGTLAKLATGGAGGVAATPDRMLVAIVAGRRAASEALPIVQPHFFSLGGAIETARWLRAVKRGELDLDAEGTGFVVK